MSVSEIYQWFENNDYGFFTAFTHQYVDYTNMTHPVQQNLGKLFHQMPQESYYDHYEVDLLPNYLTTLDTLF